MRTPAQILGGFVGGSFPAPASANKGVAPNPILARAFPTDSRDEWRRTGHDDVVAGTVGSRDEGVSKRWGHSLVAMVNSLLPPSHFLAEHLCYSTAKIPLESRRVIEKRRIAL